MENITGENEDKFRSKGKELVRLHQMALSFIHEEGTMNMEKESRAIRNLELRKAVINQQQELKSRTKEKPNTTGCVGFYTEKERKQTNAVKEN